jgi:MFS family permease
MSLSPAVAVDTRLRHARVAVSAVFFINAVLYANLVPRLPEVKDRLDLSNAALGSAIAAMPVGALLAGLLAPALIQRLGSAKVTSFGLVVLAVAVAGVPLSGTWIVFAGLMLVIGALDAVVDVAQNAHGFRVQRGYGRSIVNAFHGLWSVGAVVGGLLGSVAAGLSVPLAAHLSASAAVFGVAAFLAYRLLLDGPEDAERVANGGGASGGAVDSGGGTGVSGTAVSSGAVDSGAADSSAADSSSSVSSGPMVGGGVAPEIPARRWGRLPGHTVLMLAALGALAACGAFVEDAGASWGALYLRGEVGTSVAAGGLAFVALQVAMTAGRLTGDRVVNRFGQRRVALAGGAAITLGMGVALAVPSLGTTLLGFTLAGLGVATLIPAVMHTADELPGLPHGVGLTIVSWLLRVGFLISPTVVGFVADAISLRVALLGVVLAGVGVLLLGRVLVGTAAPANKGA